MNSFYVQRILVFSLLMLSWSKPNQAQVCADNDFVLSCSPCFYIGSGYPGYAFFHANGTKDVTFTNNEDIYYYGAEATVQCKSSTKVFNFISANLPSGSTVVCQGKIKNYMVCSALGNSFTTKTCPKLGSDQFSIMQLQKFRISTVGTYPITFNNGNGTTVNLTVVDGASYTPAVTITSNIGNTISAGTSVTFSLSENFTTGGGTYQWKKNGTAVTALSSYITNTLQNGDVITVSGTYTCGMSLGNNPLTSNSITMTVNSVMPVELSTFVGAYTEGGNELTWTTASEQNSDVFKVERRDANSDTWKLIGFVSAKGKSARYTFLDDLNPPTTAYYRLRMKDKDGKESTSKVISVQKPTKPKLSIYPNPVTTILTVEQETISDYHIFNLVGQEVMRGTVVRSIDVSALPQGVYTLKIGAEQVRFVKQ